MVKMYKDDNNMKIQLIRKMAVLIRVHQLSMR